MRTVFSGVIPISNTSPHYIHFSLGFENMRLYPKIFTILISLLLLLKLFSNVAEPLTASHSSASHSLVHPFCDIYTLDLGLHTKLKCLPYLLWHFPVCVISNILASRCVPQLRRFRGQKFSKMVHITFYSWSSTVNISELCTA